MLFNFFDEADRIGARDEHNFERRENPYLKSIGVYDHVLMSHNPWELFCIYVWQGIYDAVVCILGTAVGAFLVLQLLPHFFDTLIDIQFVVDTASRFLTRLKPYLPDIW